MKLTQSITVMGIAALLGGATLSAMVTPEEAEKLNGEFTPFGAIRAGNDDGTIPAWDGGIKTPPANYQAGMHHSDPFVEDQPLFTITAENVLEYRDLLSAGYIAMFNQYPQSWKMHVYPTRRSASYPEFVYDAVKANAVTASLTEGGNGVANASVSSPFPMPRNGLEAIWNHLLRYRGETIQRVIAQAAPTSSGSYSLVKIDEQILIPYNKKGTTIAEINNRLAYFMQEVTAPAYLAGEILLVHDTVDQNSEPRLAWVYNPGQRRVRRAPNVAFDNPGTAADGQRTTDQFDMFNGSPERYTWELVGRREMIVPYNSYKLHSNSVSYSEILQPGHINSDLARYERHRVWEVHATVKPETSHIYAKRVFFIDEDSWQILAVDQYDSRGNIWRVSEAHVINYYQIPMLWDTLISHYDLQNGRYLVIGMNNEEPNVENFNVDYSRSDFMPERLRRRGRR